MRAALLVSLATAGVLSFVVFPVRPVAVVADGTAVVVLTRYQDPARLLSSAGLVQHDGDILLRGRDQIVLQRAIPLVVEVDGRSLPWRTRASTVQHLLGELDLQVSPFDTLLYNGVPVALDAVVYDDEMEAAGPGPAPERADDGAPVVTIERAVPVAILVDGRLLSVQSSRGTVGEVLREAAIAIGPADDVTPGVLTPVTAGMEVRVRHAMAVVLRLGESTRVIYTHQQSLAPALAETGIALGDSDRVEPGLHAPLTNGMEARVVRVSEREFTEREEVPHGILFRPDDSLSGAQTRVEEGRSGVLVNHYHAVIEDGVQLQPVLQRGYFDPEPSDTVIYFSADTLTQFGLEAMSFRPSGSKRMWATWYTPASSGRPAGDPAYGITASGIRLIRGVVAVDPEVIPLGTWLYVPGYGLALAADTGGGIIGDMIDLGYPDGAVVDWHTGWTDVYILEPSHR